MRTNAAVICLAFIAVAGAVIIEITALMHGINGTVTHSVLAIIGCVVGYAFKAVTPPKKRKE